MTNSARHGWTSHGHQIPGATNIGPRPNRVARCGGTMLCDKCKAEAMAVVTKMAVVEASIHLAENESGKPEQILTADAWGSIKGAPKAMTAITVTTTNKSRVSKPEQDEYLYPEAVALALEHGPSQPLALARVQEYVTADKYQGGIEHVYEWTFIPKAT